MSFWSLRSLSRPYSMTHWEIVLPCPFLSSYNELNPNNVCFLIFLPEGGPTFPTFFNYHLKNNVIVQICSLLFCYRFKCLTLLFFTEFSCIFERRKNMKITKKKTQICNFTVEKPLNRLFLAPQPEFWHQIRQQMYKKNGELLQFHRKFLILFLHCCRQFLHHRPDKFCMLKVWSWHY